MLTKEQRDEYRRDAVEDLDKGGCEGCWAHQTIELLDHIDEAERERMSIAAILDEYQCDEAERLPDRVIGALDTLTDERDGIARARDCGAPAHATCALPPGNVCDAHTIAKLHQGLTTQARNTELACFSFQSPGRKKLHLMIAEAEAREEDARRELEVHRAIQRGRDSAKIEAAIWTPEQVRSWSVSRRKYAVGEVASNDGVPVVCTHVGAAPSANLQASDAASRDREALEQRPISSFCRRGCGATVAGDGTRCDICDALPEYQLAPVEREAPARVLAVLTRR